MILFSYDVYKQQQEKKKFVNCFRFLNCNLKYKNNRISFYIKQILFTDFLLFAHAYAAGKRFNTPADTALWSGTITILIEFEAAT